MIIRWLLKVNTYQQFAPKRTVNAIPLNLKYWHIKMLIHSKYIERRHNIFETCRHSMTFSQSDSIRCGTWFWRPRSIFHTSSKQTCQQHRVSFMFLLLTCIHIIIRMNALRKQLSCVCFHIGTPNHISDITIIELYLLIMYSITRW